VTAMRRVGDHAQLDLTINRGAHVPAAVSAHLTQTSLIGETIVSLQPVQGQPTTPTLADGANISDTRVDPGVEQLVQAGTTFLGALSANDIATILQQGAQAFGDQGPSLHQFNENFNGLLTTVKELGQHQKDLSDILGQFPIFLKWSQELTHPEKSLSQIPVVFDTITCGLPTQMGGADPNDPLTSCHGAS